SSRGGRSNLVLCPELRRRRNDLCRGRGTDPGSAPAGQCRLGNSQLDDWFRGDDGPRCGTGVRRRLAMIGWMVPNQQTMPFGRTVPAASGGFSLRDGTALPSPSITNAYLREAEFTTIANGCRSTGTTPRLLHPEELHTTASQWNSPYQRRLGVSMQNIIVEKPYQFVPPHRGNWLPRMLLRVGQIHTLFNRFGHGVVSHECRNVERLRESL